VTIEISGLLESGCDARNLNDVLSLTTQPHAWQVCPSPISTMHKVIQNRWFPNSRIKHRKAEDPAGHLLNLTRSSIPSMQARSCLRSACLCTDTVNRGSTIQQVILPFSQQSEPDIQIHISVSGDHDSLLCNPVFAASCLPCFYVWAACIYCRYSSGLGEAAVISRFLARGLGCPMPTRNYSMLCAHLLYGPSDIWSR